MGGLAEMSGFNNYIYNLASGGTAAGALKNYWCLVTSYPFSGYQITSNLDAYDATCPMITVSLMVKVGCIPQVYL